MILIFAFTTAVCLEWTLLSKMPADIFSASSQKLTPAMSSSAIPYESHVLDSKRLLTHRVDVLF